MKNQILSQIKNYVLQNKENWNPETHDRIYDSPIIHFADADDPLFEEFKTVVGKEHLTPREAYEITFGENSYHGGTIISVVMPINEKMRKSNRIQKIWPSKEWRLLPLFHVNGVSHFIIDLLAGMGYKAVAPGEAEWYRLFADANGPISNWSERHVAYAAGLGTFSLNQGFISEKGMAIVLLSVITELKLEPDVRKVHNHLENCLHYSSGTCGACIQRCPVHAITENGHDKMKCYNHVYGAVQNKYGVSQCGLCQTKVPCEYRNPT